MIKSKGLAFIITFIFIISSVFIPVSAGGKFFYDGVWNTHTHADVSLYINNNKLELDVPPLIIEDRTLVPVRHLFEKLGATVTWKERTREVQITTDEYKVVLYIDNKKATVNNKTVFMDVPAKIITDSKNVARTFVPARFVSEKLGYTVLWDEKESRVTIKTDDIKENEIDITSIKNYTSSGNDVIEVNFSKKPEIKTSRLSDPERLIIDFENSRLSMVDGATNKTGIDVLNVRYAYHSGSHSRVVIDLKSPLKYTTYVTNTSYKIVLENKGGQAVIKPNDSKLLAVNKNKLNKIVVIDPGHGGSDPGALGKNEDGEIELYEKDVNLDISLEVVRLLKSAGLNVYATRSTDIFVGLIERAEFANNLNADLFVSVHQNSFTSNEASGSLILYYPHYIEIPENEENDGEEVTEDEVEEISTGKILAENILKQLVTNTGATDRGLLNGSRYIVINQTDMPAVIVECAFISNDDEREKMKTDEFKNTIALSIANGIIKTINEQ